MTHNSPKLLARLAEKQALIIEDIRGGYASYAAYPGGDRRRRPVSWISKDLFRAWVSDGAIVPRGKGYEVAPSAARRGQGPHAGAHRNMQSQSIAGETGVYRPAQVNLNTRTALRVLGERPDKNGIPFLNASELEAAERFSADYSRAAYGRAQTQDYAHAGADITRTNTAENAAIAAIDSRARIQAAIDYVGPGLSRAVISVCGENMGLEQMEKIEGWTRRSGGTVLKLALQRLTDFYGTMPGVYAPSPKPESLRASL